MLKLSNIVKDYADGSNTVHALKGVSIAFRPSEFVAILGQSGCGKTTLLNIIGGLDCYTSGDLVIRGKSTKNYKARDWDTYRNHSVGFVFQSYNLIPHQSVLANVELALTLSGVKKAERRRRAAAALEKVGLGDQLHKKPNQMSGGQMQRVAIARALVNDPEILLADEPTGALDSETSVQVMELLKEIARDRLVIMVTHNPELAERYATRTVRLLDGQIIDDSNPYEGESEEKSAAGKEKKSSMSALTAFSLSLSNLMTKKGRAIMTAFAGSIGIIGIALILSISTGVNRFIDNTQRDTAASSPIRIDAQTTSMGDAFMSMMDQKDIPDKKSDHIYTSNVMTGMIDAMFSSTVNNDLTAFKHFIESGDSGLEPLTTEIRYLYGTPLNVYRNGQKVNPSTVMSDMMMGSEDSLMSMNANVWSQLTSNQELLNSQYQLISGRLPSAWNEVVLTVDEDNLVPDYTLYTLGVLDMAVLQEALQQKLQGLEPEIDTSIHEYSYADFIGMKFQLLPSSAHYREVDGLWKDMSDDEAFIAQQLQSADEVQIVGILRSNPDSSNPGVGGYIGYTDELMLHMIELVESSPVVAAQRANPGTDIFTGLPFADPNAEPTLYTMAQIMEMMPTLPQELQTAIGTLMQTMQGAPEEMIAKEISTKILFNSSNLERNLTRLGVSDLDKPIAIELYAKDFDSKEEIANIIESYNASRPEAQKLTYTDMTAMLMSGVSTVVTAISSVLIVFVSISLIVSSIMIAIITGISVLERTKEIGILRAVGASKGDVKRVFIAETVIEGLAAGLVGIGVTQLLLIPINLLIQNVFKLNASAVLPLGDAAWLVLISVTLTFIAGLSPASKAARKDPVVALRSE
ncbi:MAG: ABC transporter ATP-binding protein/permease [Oscillospiraceae bacterium]|nr:ABC transporter ATP-binding protein/permease [Oscillospiraceae bacterium]